MCAGPAHTGTVRTACRQNAWNQIEKHEQKFIFEAY